MKISRICILLAALVSLVGCGSKGEDPIGTTGSDAAKSAGRTVTILSWDEYFDPEVFEKFAKETGIDVVYRTFEEFDELEAMLTSQPGEYDVVVADGTSLERFIELRLVRSLDREKLPNFKNLDPEYLGWAFDLENEYSVPYCWGTTLVAYRSDKIENPQESWSILTNPEYKDKVMVLGDRTEALGISLMANGSPINSSDKEQLGAAASAIVDLIDSVNVRFGSDVEIMDAIDSGDAWVSVCYSGDAALVASENENVRFFIPEEGAPLWMDNFTIASASQRGGEAHELINFLIRAESAAANANVTWYASPNSAARELISEELLADTTINPPDSVRDRCKLFEKPDAHREEMLNEAWLRVQAALRERGDIASTVAEPE